MKLSKSYLDNFSHIYRLEFSGGYDERLIDKINADGIHAYTFYESPTRIIYLYFLLGWYKTILVLYW